MRVELLPTSACHVQRTRDPVLEMSRFLDVWKPDTILTWESPRSIEFPALWRKKGIRWLNVVHWEWFNPRLMEAWKTAELISPNPNCQKLLLERYRLKSVLLPVPVDTERFQFRKRRRAESFLTVYARGGPHNRRSLPEILLAWSDMENPPPLTVKAQERPPEFERFLPPSCVALEHITHPEPEDLYLVGDVAIQLSRYEGVGMTILEAMSSGMPVITTKGSPMSDLAPEFTVQVEDTTVVPLAGKEVTAYTPSAQHLRSVVLAILDKDITGYSEAVRKRVELVYSWKVLRQEWLKLLAKPGRSW